MDEQRIANWRRKVRLNSDVGKRQHGPVRVIKSSADPIISLADKVRELMTIERNRQACKLIDGDFQRGGFPPHMRHAR